MNTTIETVYEFSKTLRKSIYRSLASYIISNGEFKVTHFKYGEVIKTYTGTCDKKTTTILTLV